MRWQRWWRVARHCTTSVRQWFTDVEIVKLTMIIAATNAWNRVELSFSRQLPNSAAATLSGFSVATAFAFHANLADVYVAARRNR
jgi:hypothetical protein